MKICIITKDLDCQLSIISYFAPVILHFSRRSTTRFKVKNLNGVLISFSCFSRCRFLFISLFTIGYDSFLLYDKAAKKYFWRWCTKKKFIFKQMFQQVPFPAARFFITNKKQLCWIVFAPFMGPHLFT